MKLLTEKKNKPVSAGTLESPRPSAQISLDEIAPIKQDFSREHRQGMKKPVRFIDLFAGIGGIRKGFELACADRGIAAECVFTSEIKSYAVDVLKQNHPDEEVHGDITQIQASNILRRRTRKCRPIFFSIRMTEQRTCWKSKRSIVPQARLLILQISECMRKKS